MVAAHINGVRHALAAGWRVLERGGSSLDAVEEAVVILEDDETFGRRPRQLPQPRRPRCNSTRSSWMAPRCALEELAA